MVKKENFWHLFTFKNVETDTAEPVNIGVVHFGQESDLGCRHWVFLRKEQLQLELSPLDDRISQ